MHKTAWWMIGAFSLALMAGPGHAQEAMKPQPVQIKLSEWTMGFKTLSVTGPAQFEVVNDGQYPHAFAIEGKLGGQDFEISTGVLKAGEKTTLTVALPKGSYNAYCPVGNHEERGMQGELIFK